jgi:hypothetical protein
MADSYLIDTNVLLRISLRDDASYRIVDAALEQLLVNETALYFTHQNIAESS